MDEVNPRITRVEGPAGVLLVLRSGARNYAVHPIDGTGQPALYRTHKKDRAVGWATCKAGIEGDDRPPTT